MASIAELLATNLSLRNETRRIILGQVLKAAGATATGCAKKDFNLVYALSTAENPVLSDYVSRCDAVSLDPYEGMSIDCSDAD